MTKEEIIRKYLGAPYLHKGRSIDGVDCYGLVALVYRELGIEIPDYEYKEKWYKDGKDYYVDNYHELWEKVDVLKEWDCILFKNRSNVVNHVGIYLGDNKFLQCCEGSPVEVADITRKYWAKCTYGYFRYKVI